MNKITKYHNQSHYTMISAISLQSPVMPYIKSTCGFTSATGRLTGTTMVMIISSMSRKVSKLYTWNTLNHINHNLYSVLIIIISCMTIKNNIKRMANTSTKLNWCLGFVYIFQKDGGIKLLASKMQSLAETQPLTIGEIQLKLFRRI